jgi:hypothetical protein
VHDLELEPIRVGEEGRVVVRPVRGSLVDRRRVEHGRPELEQTRVRGVHLLAALGVQREVVEARRVAVVGSRPTGGVDVDGGEAALEAQGVLTLPRLAEADRAEETLVEGCRSTLATVRSM